MSAEDPFCAEADPYPLDTRVDRRTLGRVAVALVVLSGCAHLPLGCKSADTEGRTCRQRFCRYYRAVG